MHLCLTIHVMLFLNMFCLTVALALKQTISFPRKKDYCHLKPVVSLPLTQGHRNHGGTGRSSEVLLGPLYALGVGCPKVGLSSWAESCIIPAQMMRNKLNFDNQQRKFQNFDVPLRTTSFCEGSEIGQFCLF
jgi:hypothetical protein